MVDHPHATTNEKDIHIDHLRLRLGGITSLLRITSLLVRLRRLLGVVPPAGRRGTSCSELKVMQAQT